MLQLQEHPPNGFFALLKISFPPIKGGFFRKSQIHTTQNVSCQPKHVACPAKLLVLQIFSTEV